MTIGSIERLVIAGAIVYLVAFGWSVASLPYDLWGAFVVLPPLSLVGVVALRRLFPGPLGPVGTIMVFGLFVKFGGALARYWVGFEAYGGGIDAQRYHNYAVEKATLVWSGEANVWTLIPDGTGTPLMEDITAVVYAVTGASKLGGFFVFAFLAYLGTAWFVKAACVAVPGLLQRRYAVLCVVAPSIVYWPSSIGKEAWMFLTLGLATYGIALLFARRGVMVPVVFAVVGLLGAATMRPHIAGLWIAGLFPALVIALFARRTDRELRGNVSHKFVLAGVIVLAGVGLSIAAGATLRVLDFADEEETGTNAVTAIIDETTRRTLQAGSNFQPPSIENPADWPVASIRTMTRPLLFEARGAGQLLSALEMTALVGLALVGGRRMLSVPKHLLTVPFVAYAATVVFLGSLAYTSFANLGVLTRQRTLLFPFLLVLFCLPLARKREHGAVDPSGRSMELSDSRQLALVGSGSGWEATPTNATPDWTPSRLKISTQEPAFVRPADDVNWDRRAE